MFTMTPSPNMTVRKEKTGRVSLLVLSPKKPKANAPGILWIHGGGYILGMKEMVYISRAAALVEKYGAVVASPGYRLAFQKPYPAAIDDCYLALLWMKEHAKDLGINPRQLMVGGESAGGGLCAALCMMARDQGEVNIAWQMPLYPMIDNFDTDSSKDNHGRVWNTRRNHLGWRMYLRRNAKKAVSPYAAAARETDFAGLPPAYTFVGDGEPFYSETLAFIKALQDAGIPAEVDVYPTNVHAFDILKPELEISKQAIQRFEEHFQYAAEHYFTECEANG